MLLGIVNEEIAPLRHLIHHFENKKVMPMALQCHSDVLSVPFHMQNELGRVENTIIELRHMIGIKLSQRAASFPEM